MSYFSRISISTKIDSEFGLIIRGSQSDLYISAVTPARAVCEKILSMSRDRTYEGDNFLNN